MQKIAVGFAGIVALAFAGPVVAQTYGSAGHHSRTHDQVEAAHDDGHDQLDEQHTEAHEWDLTRGEHRQVHRELQYEHRSNDFSLRQQHVRHDRYDRWNRNNARRNYRSSGFYGY